MYDKNHHQYRNQILKDKKWLEFSEAEKVSVDSVKKKWKSMRDRFYRVKKQENIPSGSGRHSTPEYKYSQQLQFLTEVNASNMDTSGNYEDDIVVEVESEDNGDFSSSSFTSSIPKKRKMKPTSAVDMEILKALQNVKPPTVVTPFRTFLESIAQTIESPEFSHVDTFALQMEIMQLVHSKK